jgi:DNA-binding NarL/FixJ family response regulator
VRSPTWNRLDPYVADGVVALVVLAIVYAPFVITRADQPGPFSPWAWPCRALMLTTFDQDDYVYDALYGGASGFLLKDVRRDDLVHAVRVVAAGESLLAPTVTRRLISDLTARRPRSSPANGLDVLTARERETLRLLGRGLSNVEIVTTMVISEHTAKTHVSNVLAKLGLRDRVQAVIAAYESGLIAPGAS